MIPLLRISDDVIVSSDSIALLTKLAPTSDGDFDLKVVLKTRGFAPHPTKPKEIMHTNMCYVLTGADAQRLWEIAKGASLNCAQAALV